MNIPRESFGAGIVIDEITQEKLVVVSGGLWITDRGYHPITSTEILVDEKWILG